jgi:hypothetical protein
MSIAPGILSLTFPQGATWDLSLTYVDGDGDPIDLTAHTARMQVRNSYTADPPVLSLASGTGITLGGTAGTIDIQVAASVTDDIAALQYVYDLEVEAASIVTRVVQGSLTVTPEVTR